MSKIQFIHRRPVDAATRDFSSRGGFTVAYRAVPEDNHVEYSVAVCSDRDNFNKKLGRDIAAGRLTRGMARRIVVGTEEDFREVMFNQAV